MRTRRVTAACLAMAAIIRARFLADISPVGEVGPRKMKWSPAGGQKRNRLIRRRRAAGALVSTRREPSCVARFAARPSYGTGSPAGRGVRSVTAGTWMTNVQPLPGLLRT